MKILLVHKYFFYNGGADVFFFEVGRVLEEQGHEVAYFSTKNEKNLETKWEPYFISPPQFNGGNALQKAKAFFEIPYNFRAKRQFEQLLDDFQPDLIHAFNIMTQISPSVLTAARERNIPVVISLNDYKHICPNYKLFHHGHICESCKPGNYYNCLKNKCSHDSFAYSFASMVEAYVHKGLDVYTKNISLFLFASDFMRDKTIEFWGKEIPTGKLLNPFHIPPKPDGQDGGNYGLYFGRLIEEKGVDVLLKALTLAKEVPFKIVGDGPQEEMLRAYARENGLSNVEFLGPKWGDELDELLNKAQFVVVPSVWHENFPYVVIQSFAAGKPVIGTNNGGIPELISDKRGLLYDYSNFSDLAEKIRELYVNNEQCRTFGAAARQYVEETFSDVHFYNSLIENYKRVLN